MPTATAEPPAAPAPAPAQVGAVAPPSTGTITPASLAEGNPTVTPPKPGSARAKMFDGLRKKAGVTEPSAPAAPAKPAAAPAAEPAAPAEPAAAQPGAPAAPAEPATAVPGDKKVSPWKLVDQFKARAAAAEAKALELEKQVMPEAKRKETEDRIAKYEARVKEMEGDLRYFNAEKYDPDILKAHADYEGAWNRALNELGELTVADGASGQQRPVKAEDILSLVNMPLAQAREIADSVFGPFADDVMAHRKEIKNLYEAKRTKLEELKKNGAERDQQRKEQQQRTQGEIAGQIKAAWEREAAAVVANEKHGKYFKTREGDDDWNSRLEKGYQFVDDALMTNIADPKLSPDERANAVRKHVALRNRAAAFSAMRLDYERMLAKLDQVEKELGQYKASTPGAGGTAPASAAPATGRAFDTMINKMRAKAK